MRRLIGGLLIGVLAACGGGSGGGTTTNPTAPVLTVAGEYPTVVTLTENACGAVTVMSLPTTVAHQPGATAVTLTHGGTAYRGSVQSDGQFTTDPTSVTTAEGTFTVRMVGRFTTSGLEATVTVDRTSPGGSTCRYVVRWVGTKQGAPNVLP